MDSQDYRLLLDLYEEKSITLLAQRYFLSQPALTKRIQRMEEELGCTLLHRRKRGVTFTAAGERMLTYCREMLHMEQELREDLNRSKGVVGGSLSILCSNSYSYYRLPMALKQYRARCPQVRVQVTVGRSAALYQQFLRREDCVAILRGEWAWGDGRAALALPHHGIINGLARETVPDDYGLALVGNGQRILHIVATAGFHHFANGLHHVPVDFLRVMLHPARLRIILLMRYVLAADELALFVEQHSLRGRRTLVDSDDVSHRE